MSGGTHPVTSVTDAETEAFIYDIFTKHRIAPPPQNEVTCCRCGRVLRSERSRKLGRGPRCNSRIMRAARSLASSDNRSARKAAELIEDGAMVPIRTHGGRVWRTVSYDGQRTYLTSADGCNCPAGLHELLCYHRVALTILTES